MSQEQSVLVAMSGGVDSCAAATILCEQGFNVIGVSMQVWDYRNHGGNSSRATCCAPSDFQDARLVAEKYGFPFYIFDFEESFKSSVIDPFVNSYINGETPNPCLNCNKFVKFKQLRERAAKLGISLIATGHYAQIKKINDSYALFTSKDNQKDQTYFLYALTQDELSKTLFPVGAMVKKDVRDLLRIQEVEVADKAESQDICFVSGSVSDFIKNNSSFKSSNGEIINQSGEVLGYHTGIINFTVGQRKGLGISAEHPLYVISIDSLNNKVVVGPREELKQVSFYLNNVNWIRTIPTESFKSSVKLRYRQRGIECLVTPLDATTAKVEFLDDWTTVSPGQAGVMYSIDPDSDGDFEVIGGGIISNNMCN